MRKIAWGCAMQPMCCTMVTGVTMLIPSANAFAEPPVPTFAEAADDVGLDAVHDTATSLIFSIINVSGLIGGGAAGDFNNDGWQDVFFLGGGDVPDKLFINDGDGTFTDRALEWGIQDSHIGMSAAVGDFNNDGWLDIFVASIGPGCCTPDIGLHKLYRNNSGDSFTDVAVQAGVNQTSRDLPDGFGAAFGDYDLDGDLDLYVTGWVDDLGNRMFRNNGDETFTDVTVDADLLDTDIRGFAPRFVDMNGDRYPELLVAADFSTSRYYANNGDGTFHDATMSSGTGLDANGMGQTVADFNNDGMFDWYVTSVHSAGSGMLGVPGTGNMLYMADGATHHYAESSIEAGVNDGGWGWGTVSVDVNHDGLVDIVETNGWGAPNGSGDFEWSDESSYVFLNTDGDHFVDVADACAFEHNYHGRGLINLDADNDGDQDFIVFSLNEELVYLRNETANSLGHWLRVFLKTSETPNLAPNGFGSIVTVSTQGLTQTRSLDGGCNYISQSELSAHFGLAQSAYVDELRVLWSDGTISKLAHVQANQTLTIDASADPADVNGDGTVGPHDLFILLGHWGRCSDCAADLNEDGIVNHEDIASVLSAWSS